MVRKKNEIIPVQVEGPFNGGGTLTRESLIKGDEELNGKGRLFSKNTLAPGSAIGYHEHRGDSEFYYILSGEGEYDDNGTKVKVTAGDLALCPAGEGHALKNTGNGPLEFIALILYV